MTRLQKTLLLLFIFPSLSSILLAQNNYSEYNFIHLQKNQFKNWEKSQNFELVMHKFKQLCNGKNENTEVLHLGNSHIQAGIYPNQIRKAFRKFFLSDSVMGYGMVFPFKTAQTNNPDHYSVSWNGKWTTCKPKGNSKKCSSGIFPVMLKTKDSCSTLSLKFHEDQSGQSYSFNQIKLFCKYPDSTYLVTINGKAIEQKNKTIFKADLEKATDSVKLKIHHTNHSDSSFFKLHGMNLLNTSQPFHYHSVGVNGAKVNSYLNSQHFPMQLKSINPDWVIVSLGTNEAYNQEFDKKQFRKHLEELIQLIRNHTDNCWILLTTPGDALWQGKFSNMNNSRAGKIIINTSKKKGCSYWDFYEVMGSNNAISQWYEKGLSSEDMLHLSPNGYIFKANLFFDAFYNSFNTHFNKQIERR